MLSYCTRIDLGMIIRMAEVPLKFHRSSIVPYALRPKVDVELKRMEQQGIISKIHWSEWANPWFQFQRMMELSVFLVILRSALTLFCKWSSIPCQEFKMFSQHCDWLHFSKVDLRQVFLLMEIQKELPASIRLWSVNSAPSDKRKQKSAAVKKHVLKLA